MNRGVRLAFWINAYTTSSVKLIVAHDPLENVWAAIPEPAEPKTTARFCLRSGPWTAEGTLDEIEHEIIRERFDEPRIHVALVCGSQIFLRTWREAYTGSGWIDSSRTRRRAFSTTRKRIAFPPGTIG